MAAEKKPDGDIVIRNAPVVIGDDGGPPPAPKRIRQRGMYLVTRYDWTGLEDDMPFQIVIGAISGVSFNGQPVSGFEAFSFETNNQKKWIRGYYDQGALVIAASDKMAKDVVAGDYYFYWQPAEVMVNAYVKANGKVKKGLGKLQFVLP